MGIASEYPLRNASVIASTAAADDSLTQVDAMAHPREDSKILRRTSSAEFARSPARLPSFSPRDGRRVAGIMGKVQRFMG